MLCCTRAEKCKAGFLLVCETNNLVYSGIRVLVACTQQDKQQRLWSSEEDIMGKALTTQAEPSNRARHGAEICNLSSWEVEQVDSWALLTG